VQVNLEQIQQLMPFIIVLIDKLIGDKRYSQISKSLGLRCAKTETQYAAFMTGKQESKQRVKSIKYKIRSILQCVVLI